METYNQPQLDPAAAEAAAKIGTGVLILYVILAIGGIALMIYICLALMEAFKRIPAQFRRMEPGMVWLLFVPCVNLVWIFLCPARLSESFRNYFSAAGVPPQQVGDCASGKGLWWGLTTLLCFPVGWIFAFIYVGEVKRLTQMLPPAQG